MGGFSKEDAASDLAERRYQAIADILQTAVTKGGGRWTYTDIFDHVFLHRWLGIPIFLSLLWAVFAFTFSLSEPFMVMIELLFGRLGALAEEGIANPHLASFVAGGIVDGLGSVLVFVPPIFMLFFALSNLEDSGYLSRAASVMERLMHGPGLHGSPFMLKMIGFKLTSPPDLVDDAE